MSVVEIAARGRNPTVWLDTYAHVMTWQAAVSGGRSRGAAQYVIAQRGDGP